MPYDFELTFSHEEDVDDMIERLAEKCDDALVGTGAAGIVALWFTRDADTEADAISSALADVRAAAPTAILRETVIHP